MLITGLVISKVIFLITALSAILPAKSTPSNSKLYVDPSTHSNSLKILSSIVPIFFNSFESIKVCGEFSSFDPATFVRTRIPSARSSLRDIDISFLLTNALSKGLIMERVGFSLSKTIFFTIYSGALLPAASLPSNLIL